MNSNTGYTNQKKEQQPSKERIYQNVNQFKFQIYMSKQKSGPFKHLIEFQKTQFSQLTEISIPKVCCICTMYLDHPIRNKDCQGFDCVYHLECLLGTFNDQILNKEVFCSQCHAIVQVKNFYHDLDTDFYLYKAKLSHEDFADRDELELTMSNKNQWNIKNTKDKSSECLIIKTPLKTLNMDESQTVINVNNSSVEFQTLETKVLDQVNEGIAKNIQTNLQKIQCLPYTESYLKINQSNQQIFVEKSGQDIDTCIKQDIKIGSFSDYLENKYVFTISKPQYSNNQPPQQQEFQFYIHLYLAPYGKWFKILVKDIPVNSLRQDQQKKTYADLKMQNYTSYCKVYNKTLQKHSIILLGGQSSCCTCYLNKTFEVELFSKSPQTLFQEVQIVRTLKELSDYKVGIAYPVIFGFEQKVFSFGGYVFNNTATQDCYYYDLSKNQWNFFLKLPTLRFNYSIALNPIQKECLIFGGIMLQSGTNAIPDANKIYCSTIEVINLSLIPNQQKIVIMSNQYPVNQKQPLLNIPQKGIGFIRNNDICTFGGRKDDYDYNKKEKSKIIKLNIEGFQKGANFNRTSYTIENNYIRISQNQGYWVNDTNFIDYVPIQLYDQVYSAYVENYSAKLLVFDQSFESSKVIVGNCK